MGKIKKVVIDTNIFISAFGWGGLPRKVLSLLEETKIISYTSIELMDELKHTLSYPKLKFSESLQGKIIEFVFYYSVVVKPKIALTVIKNDPDDNMVLECAIEAEADYIVSGDSDLLTLKEFQGIKILSVKDFFKTIQ